MQRYFVDVNKNNVIFSQDDIFHITKVMRMKISEQIELVDKNSHQVYLGVINSTNPLVVSIQEPILKNAELSKDVTLFFALAKSDKIDFVIQKATELGVKSIVLFQGKRSIVKYSNEDFNRKKERYLSIAKEASEQCHREVIPSIEYLPSIKEVSTHLADLNLFAYELEAGTASDLNKLVNEAQSISIIIGPEGGFDESEAEYLKSLKFVPISLGKRILRCETAAVYSLSVLSYLLDK